MKFYVVTNGSYVDGYYCYAWRARVRVKYLNDLIVELKDHPNLDETPYFVEEMETED